MSHSTTTDFDSLSYIFHIFRSLLLIICMINDDDSGSNNDNNIINSNNLLATYLHQRKIKLFIVQCIIQFEINSYIYIYNFVVSLLIFVDEPREQGRSCFFIFWFFFLFVFGTSQLLRRVRDLVREWYKRV